MNKSEMNIRPGTAADLLQASSLLVATWQQGYQEFMPKSFLDELQVEKQLGRHEKYFSQGTQYLIAENEKGEMLGFTSFGKNRMDHIDCARELYTLYVKRSVQGRGVGTALIISALQELKPHYQEIVVSVFEENPFLEFYTKNDFRKIGEEMIDLGAFNLLGGIYIRKF